MKRPNDKRKTLDNMYERSVKIKCCYCDLKEDCRNRATKEKSEKMGFTTYCSMTPNRPKSFVKRQKKAVHQ